VTEAAPQPRRLHPATLIARWLKIVPQTLAAGAGLVVAARDQGLGRFLILGAVMLLLGAVFAFLFWWRFRYTVGASEIVIEKGLIQRQRRVIPFDRVQDIAIEQRLLARLFGTAKVRIETGGAAKDEGNLDMIALADAHKLRDVIRRGARPAAEAEAESESESESEAPAQPADEPILFEMDLPRLLYSGLFGFSLIFLAVISGILQQLDQLGVVDWQTLFAEKFTVERAEGAANLVTIRLALGLAALVILLGVVAGILRTVTRDYGFRLTRSEAGLRRRRGLFTLSEVVIPIRRTQVALIETGLVTRLLGWYRLSFQTLGADKKEGGVQVAAPFARMEELLPILAEAGFPAPPERSAFRSSPRRALLRRMALYVLIGAALTIAAFLIDPRAGIGALAAALLACWAVLRWRTHGHAEDERALYVTGGLLRRRLRIMPHEKLQTISVSRGPLQRRMRLATLLVDTAGASSTHPLRMVDLDAAEADAKADRLYGAFLRARARLRSA
jgi:putative membrane protein